MFYQNAIAHFCGSGIIGDVRTVSLLGAHMISVPNFLRPPVKTHGGKRYLARKIVAQLPSHYVYVEPFAGGLSVLLNKPPSPIEVVGDLNAGLIAFYHMLRDRTGDLLDRIRWVDYSADNFAWAQESGAADDPLEAAVRFLVRNRFSRDGLGQDFSWSERQRGGRPGDLNAWETAKQEFPRIAARLERVELRCQDALEVIREFDGPDTLFYLDPPYHPATRTARKMYGHEMDAGLHAQFVETIVGCRGRVAISGYAHPLYDQALCGWDRHEFEMPNHSGQTRTKSRRVEVLWVNRG
jgi:DNA adenine methylase